MLQTIATGKKPEGAKRRPTPTAAALAGYLLTITAATTLTLRRLAAEIDRDARSCRTAAEQLIAFGVEGLTWADADTLTFRPSAPAPIGAKEPEPEPVELPMDAWYMAADEGQIEEFTIDQLDDYIDRPPVEEQLSLFGGIAPTSRMEATAVTAAACSVRFRSRLKEPEPEQEPEEETTASCQLPTASPALPTASSANLAQTLCKPCAKFAQEAPKIENEGLADAMARLSATFDGLPRTQNNISAQADAPAPTHAGASKEKQEINLNQSTNVNQEALNHEFKLLIAHPKIVPRFDAAERERRIVEIREKVPDAAEHVVGTLANMMAFGTMPESVFYGALRDASATTVRNHGAFLNAKVQQLKKEYRWCS